MTTRRAFLTTMTPGATGLTLNHDGRDHVRAAFPEPPGALANTQAARGLGVPFLAAGVLTLALAVPTAAQDIGLGFWSRDLTRAESAELPPGEPLGAMVVAVYPASPAAAAGLLPSDRIVAVDGWKVLADESVRRMLARAKATGAVRLTVVRGSGRSDVVVQPAERRSFLGVACEAGDQMACTDLAVGVLPEIQPYGTRAAALLQAACDAGNGRAGTELGYWMAAGKHGPPDPAGGLALVERACEGGYPEACRLLGSWSERGHCGLEASPRQSATYYEKGCAAGSRDSCHALGIALEDGAGIAKDPAASAAAYEAACAREHDQSCIEAARMTWCCVEPRDRERAYRQYAALCGRGLEDACCRLGNSLLHDGQGPRAVPVLEKACAAGSAKCCFVLGSGFDNGLGGLAPDVSRAARAYGSACEAGHGRGCFFLGFLHDAGPHYRRKGLRLDEKRAFELYSKSCDLDYLPGCWHVGHSYATGVGAPLDPVRGLALLDKACRGGETDACVWIENLKLR